MERILNTISIKEVDRIPFILTLTHHGAKELGISIEKYYSAPENVIKGQKILQEKYQHDAVMGANYFAFEIEPFGGEVIFSLDGPPNTGKPPLANKELINSLEVPDFDHLKSYQNTLSIIQGLKVAYGNTMPIVGGVISPFSIPIPQMGFDKYIELLYLSPDEFKVLMKINIEYCTKWANAQLAAGATFIAYFDPMASTDMIPRDLFLKTGYNVAKDTFAGFNGPYAYHFTSGRATNTFGDVSTLNPLVIGISAKDQIKDLIQAYPKGPTVLGNLSGINMVNWSKNYAEKQVKSIIDEVKPLGKFILADNHGEIPYAVSNETLKGISDGIDKYGRFF
jgi:uroporphyrinogen decarboxylase